jgi:hypothetical protein
VLDPPPRNGSRALQPAPLLEQGPVGVLAGEGESPVGPPKQVPILVVDEGGIAPVLPAALHLEVVKEPGLHPPPLSLGAFPPGGLIVAFHARVVRTGAPVATKRSLPPQ